MKKNLHAMLLIIMLIPSVVLADGSQDDERAKNLFRQIRCPVCEAQTIDGSDTDAARDMRAFVLKKIENGQTDESIISDLRSAYGDSIVMTPPINAQTTALWAFPFLVFGCSLIIASLIIRRNRRST